MYYTAYIRSMEYHELTIFVDNVILVIEKTLIKKENIFYG